MSQQFGLGRGLSSLIPQQNTTQTPSPRHTDQQSSDVSGRRSVSEGSTTQNGGAVLHIPVTAIVANPHQPRLTFDKEHLAELAASIAEHGVLQPLVVTCVAVDRYELIAGERRLRAAQHAGLTEVPVIVRNATPQQKMEWALIENVQRHDLSVIEEAKAYQKLAETYKLSQEDIATRVGKSRSVVANRMRLLHLPVTILKAVSDGIISEGHAKVLLSLPHAEQQHALFALITSKHLTVRQTELRAAQALAAIGTTKRAVSAVTEISASVADVQKQLQAALAARVTVAPRGKGGRIVIEYYAPEDLSALVYKLTHVTESSSGDSIE